MYTIDSGATEPSDPGATNSRRRGVHFGVVECISIGARDDLPETLIMKPDLPTAGHAKERKRITNHRISKRQVTNTDTKDETHRQEYRKGPKEAAREIKEISRVMIYEYYSMCIGSTDPTSTQYPSACQRPSICDTLRDAVMPPQTQGACKWCGKSFSSSTSARFFPIVIQHLSNNQRCINKRGGRTVMPQEAISLSSDAADMFRLNGAKYRARDSLIGSEFDQEFLDAWDRRLKEAHSVDDMEEVIIRVVEVIRRLRAMDYLPESPHPPGMRPPPSYVVYHPPAKVWPQTLPSKYKRLDSWR